MSCTTFDEAPFAWPIDGTTPPRYLVLATEPLLAEARPGCLVAVPARALPPLIGVREVAIPNDAERVSLLSADIRIGDMTLTFDGNGRFPSIAHHRGDIEPDGVAFEEELGIFCHNATSSRLREGSEAPTPLTRTLTVTVRGGVTVDEVELVLDEECEGESPLGPLTLGGCEFTLGDSSLDAKCADVEQRHELITAGDPASRGELKAWRVGPSLVVEASLERTWGESEPTDDGDTYPRQHRENGSCRLFISRAGRVLVVASQSSDASW